MTRLYLDHNATTPQSEAVTTAMLEVMRSNWSNPSSIHRSGQESRRAVDDARAVVSALIGGSPAELTFTSGGTESVNTAIRSLLRARAPRSLVVTSSVEHSAVRELLEVLGEDGVDCVHLDMDSAGRVDPASLAHLLSTRGDDIALVSVMWANNETGVIEPIEALAAMCHDAGVPMHSDATQWVGKMPTDVSSLPLDMISFAGHKFHGPKGIGGLWARSGSVVAPLIRGGGQERGRRGGTENVPGIVGMGVAAREAMDWLQAGGHDSMEPLRECFEQSVRRLIPNACVNSESAPRIWSTSSIGFPGIEAELLLLVLSEGGLDASAGSACSSGAVKDSSVLEAMGRQPCQVDPADYGSVRFSWCRHTSEAMLTQAAEHIDRACKGIAGIHPPTKSDFADSSTPSMSSPSD
ncbi:MAG: cysteine desulfurase [Phycisphaerales bacterium]|nr:cysteine desulfurase [Phycisphaerales bacterium]